MGRPTGFTRLRVATRDPRVLSSQPVHAVTGGTWWDTEFTDSSLCCIGDPVVLSAQPPVLAFTGGTWVGLRASLVSCDATGDPAVLSQPVFAITSSPGTNRYNNTSPKRLLMSSLSTT